MDQDSNLPGELGAALPGSISRDQSGASPWQKSRNGDPLEHRRARGGWCKRTQRQSFLQKFGATGFPDFKLKLAHWYRACAISIGPSRWTTASVKKLFDNTTCLLILARDKLPLAAIEVLLSILLKLDDLLFEWVRRP